MSKLIVSPSEFKQELIQAYKLRALKKAQYKAELDRKRDENAEYQSRKAMTADERARDALMRTAKAIKTFNDAKAGHELTSFEDALKKARTLAYKADRDND